MKYGSESQKLLELLDRWEAAESKLKEAERQAERQAKRGDRRMQICWIVLVLYSLWMLS